MKQLEAIDKIDQKILSLLDDNARISTTEISHRLKISKQKVSFRIRRLIKLGVLDLFSAIIDKTRLGYFHCQIYLKLRKNNSEGVLIKKLERIPNLHWEAQTSGNYNLVIFFLAKSLSKCYLTYYKISDQFSDQIIKKEVLLTSKTYFLSHSYITGEPKRISLVELPTQEIKLKLRDLKLINTIKEQSRISVKELARKTNSSPYLVRERLAYLKRQGLISAFRIRINHKVLGYKHYMILLSFSQIQKRIKGEIIKTLIKDVASIRITETIGKWDLICDIILSKKEQPTMWLHRTLKEFRKTKTKSNILEVKGVLPINTVVYS